MVNTRKPREISWLPPTHPTIKVNVGDSSLGNLGRVGYGGLLRNNLGEWLCGFFYNLTAEVFAIIHGLELSWSIGYRDIMLESDSKCALDLLAIDNPLHPLSPLLAHIHGLLSRDWRVCILDGENRS